MLGVYLALGCLGASDSMPLAAAVPCPFRVEDIYLLDGPGSAILSADAKLAVYVREWIDAATRNERRSLCLADGHAAHAGPLEAGEPDARFPVFSPDGRWIAIVSSRNRPDGWDPPLTVPPESEPTGDIWLISLEESGRAIPLAGPKRPYGRVFADPFYGRLSFSPDGRRLAFVADDGHDPRSSEEVEAGVIVVRPDQGEGYTGYLPAQIWVADLAEKPATHAAAHIHRLTSDDVWYGDPQWAPDGQSLVVHANRTDDRESVRFSINKNYDLWQIDVASRELRALTAGPGPEVSPRFSPDGKRLLCLSSPRRGPHADIYNIAIVHLDGPQPRTQIVLDLHQDTAAPLSPPPLFPLPLDSWEPDGTVVYNAAAGTAGEVCRLDPAKGTVQRGAQETTLLQRREKLNKLLPEANSFLRDRLLADHRVVQWENDGLALDGILSTPHASLAKPPYKLVVYPHGGPHSRSTLAFNVTVEVFAAHGYAVFQPNFRGSQGYTKAFLDADRHDFGGGDMRDILTGIDALVKQGVADPQRQFVYGISYGGYMTTWLVGHTRQFRAAAAQNAVTDLNVMWGLSDIQSWTNWEFDGDPWQVPEKMRAHSPFTFVHQVRTPTLILHSRDDRRCPLAMGRMFHQGLVARKVPTQMVIYPDEGHGIRQPRHRVDVLRRTLAWFAAHDQPAAQ